MSDQLAAIREAEAAAVAYQLALTKLGVKVLAAAIRLWATVPATQKAQHSTVWLGSATTLVTLQRREAKALGRAYYRLVRALLTGATVADPAKAEPKHVSLNQLRREFATLAGTTPERLQEDAKHLRGDSGMGNVDSGAQRAAQDHGEAVLDDEDDNILVEEIERLKELEAEADRQAQREAMIDLATLGPDKLEKLVGEIQDEQVSVVDQKRQEAHDRAGARQAAAAERLAMNGARDVTRTLQQSDKRAIGYARVSQTGTPCGWCAMLISRGPVYKTKHSASYDAEGDKYHDNCHCVAVPVFSDEQYEQSSQFDLNREYQKLWPKVTQGLGGDSALSAWRRYFRTAKQAA